MNWILTFLFWAASFLEFEFLGYAANHLLKSKTGIVRNWITGYFVFFLFTMPMGLAGQFYYPSWTEYFWLQFLILAAVNFGFGFYLHKTGRLNTFVPKVKEFFTKDSLLTVLKNNWFGLLFIAFCMSLTISSQFGVMGTNYDDYYYIGKMVNLQGAPQTFIENYSNGSLMNPVKVDMTRVINTYESTYAWLSSLSGIYPAFFARISMSGIQLCLFYFLCREIGALFVCRQNAQFVIAPFALFFIPDAFWQTLRDEIGWGIYVFDFWQFVNTPYYGGSVVRMSGFLALFYFSMDLLKKLEWKKLLWVGVAGLVLMSYSTIAFPIFVLFAVGIVLVKMVNTAWKWAWKKKVLWVVGAIVLLAAAFGIGYVIWTSNQWLTLPETEVFDQYNSFILHYTTHNYSQDVLLKVAPYVLVACLLICHKELQRSYLLLSGFLYCFLYMFPFLGIIGYLSFGLGFVSFRTASAMQMMLFLASGILAVKLFGSWKYSYGFVSVAAAGFLAAVMTFFLNGQTYFSQINVQAGGVSPYGWDFSRLIDFNTDMVPDVAREIGDYFNSLPYGNYRLVTPITIPNGDVKFENANFLFVSNRIELVSPREENIFTMDNRQSFFDFMSSGETDPETALRWMEQHDIHYVLTSSEKAKQIMEDYGNPVVLTVDTKGRGPLYLVKVGEPKA